MAWREYLTFVRGCGVGCAGTFLVTHIKPWKILSYQKSELEPDSDATVDKGLCQEVFVALKETIRAQASIEVQQLVAELWEKFMSKQLSNLEENAYYITCLVAHAAAFGCLWLKWKGLSWKDFMPSSKHDLNQLSERLEGLRLVVGLQNTRNPPPRDPSSTSRSDPSAAHSAARPAARSAARSAAHPAAHPAARRCSF